MEQVLVRTIIDTLTKRLDCSGRRLAHILGLNKNTLSNNADRTIEELSPNTQKKIMSLYALIFEELPALTPDAIHMILSAHVYKNYTGETDSVISSIQQNKYELDTLRFIVQTARAQHEYRLRTESPIDLKYVHETFLRA